MLPKCPRHPEAKYIRSVDPRTRQVQLLCFVCAEALTPPTDIDVLELDWDDTDVVENSGG